MDFCCREYLLYIQHDRRVAGAGDTSATMLARPLENQMPWYWVSNAAGLRVFGAPLSTRKLRAAWLIPP